MKISDLGSLDVSITVQLRGKKYPYAPMTGATRNAITKAFPPVAIPLRPHPMYGSADKSAPMIPDDGDATYLRDCQIRHAKVCAAELCVCLGFEHDGATFSAVPAGGQTQWLMKAADAMLEALTEAEIVVATRSARDAITHGTTPEAIQGN